MAPDRTWQRPVSPSRHAEPHIFQQSSKHHKMMSPLKRLRIIGLLVLLLLAAGGAAFAPSLRIRGIRPSSGSTCSSTCSPAHHSHDSFSHGLRRIIQGGSCNKDFLSVCRNCRQSAVWRFGKAAATTDANEAVHAISRAFLAELEA